MDISALESIMCYHQAAGMGLRCSVFSGVQYGKQNLCGRYRCSLSGLDGH